MQRILRQKRACLPVRSFCLGSKNIWARPAKSCGEDGCHGCGNSTSLNTFRQMPICLRAASDRSEIDIQEALSCLSSKNSLSGKKAKTVQRGDTHKPTRMLPLLRLVRRLRNKFEAQRRRLRPEASPENRSGKGMSSQSMPNLFAQVAKRLSSDKETTSGLKPLDRLDVECGLSNQLQILHTSKKVILLSLVAALTLECRSCNNPPPSLMKNIGFLTYIEEATSCDLRPRGRARAKCRINCAESHLQCG